MNCIYLRKKTKKSVQYFYCKKINELIELQNCKGCSNKTYKQYKSMKQRTSKQAKLERERFSLFSTNKNKCYFCHSTYNLTWHEIFEGKNRRNSMKYGLCLRMCLSCHRTYQENNYFKEEWHKKGQAIFNTTYPELNFIDIFYQNYL